MLSKERIAELKMYFTRCVQSRSLSTVVHLAECGLELIEMVEALQQENNGWRERYDELDAGHSRLFKDFCKLQQENEQLRAQVARMREALHYCAYASGISKPHSQVAQQALAEIDKAIGGKEDAGKK